MGSVGGQRLVSGGGTVRKARHRPGTNRDSGASSLARIDRRGVVLLDPDTVLALQRTIGNSAMRGVISRSTPTTTITTTTTALEPHTRPITVQRHASPEHLALGTIPPGKLSNIATAKDALAAVGKPANLDASGRASVSEAVHLLSQERKRVRDWQASPPIDETDQSGQVKLVRIDNKTTRRVAHRSSARPAR